jgi:hypothetical protein
VKTESKVKNVGGLYPKTSPCFHANPITMTDAQKKEISENLDALYTYLDLYLDTMTNDEILAWKEVLKTIDPNYQNTEDEESKQ